MKSEKNKSEKSFRGVSTLDFIKTTLKTNLLLLLIIIFGSSIYGGHSILDLVDPSFNPQIQSDFFAGKFVYNVEVQPDGKILAFGHFSSYNRVPVGKLVRLNPDGSLDSTFNNQTVISTEIATPRNSKILLQPDGKIILQAPGIETAGQSLKDIIRLNSDGALDTSFNYYVPNSYIRSVIVDALGRLTIARVFSGQLNTYRIIRLNADGSLDDSFDFAPDFNINRAEVIAQGDRVIAYLRLNGSNQRLYRLNDDGSIDPSFTPAINHELNELTVQSDNKILYLTFDTSLKMFRLNENGTNDESFQPITLTGNGEVFYKPASDGKIVAGIGSSTAIFRRYLPSGELDTSFEPYTHRAFVSFAIEPGGSIVFGDQSEFNNATVGVNNFIRLTPAGILDPTFNPGGLGFQSISPAESRIKAIEPLSDGKIMLGGKFDSINEVLRPTIARLNVDSTVDETFQVNTSGTGNYFSILRDVYQIRTQSDGKILVSGWFDYVLNGAAKRNFVRLNSDGSIDPTFNLGYSIPDFSEIVGAGRNRFEILSGGKLMIGTSKLNGFDLAGPIKLNPGGDRDTSFNSSLNTQSFNMFIDDVAVQPDGKILVSGSHRNIDPFVSFVARLNADGSMDTTFNYIEEPGRLRSLLALLPNGKILVAKHSNGALFGRVQRLNADGIQDTAFNSLSMPSAVINALLVLPNGKIFVGGNFTITVNGQTGKNLLQLDADGNFEPTFYNLDNEVLALAADGEGRVLVGGGFTVIGSNGGGEPRSYVARLIDSRARFDFDGDGRSDFGVFSEQGGVWKILGSQTDQNFSTNFGLPGDKLAAADFDGDGRADIAVYRPSEGVWYLLRSREGFAAHQWGISGDQPVAGDFDGDGRADLAVFRPSSGVWYVLQSSDWQPVILQFGLSGDIPLPEADFDGDGKTDIAVWRPSEGNFYWLPSGSANQFRVVHFGASGDIPAAVDYNGDGLTDLVVYRPAEGNWYQYLSDANGGYTLAVVNFGLNGDEPVPADYDGDGKTDIAVRRQNQWHIMHSTLGYTSFVFGEESDSAVAALPMP